MDSSTTGTELAEDDEDEDEDDAADDVIGKEGAAWPTRPERVVCACNDDDCVGRLEALEDCAVARVKFKCDASNE